MVLRALTVSLQSRSLCFAKLLWLATRMPPQVPGTFEFSFGPVRYTDASSLFAMYSEIFVDRLYDIRLPNTPRILDCGANIGLTTIWFKLEYPNAKVTLFEPDPRLVNVLRGNLETLALGDDVEIVPAAVSGTTGQVSFSREGPLSGRIGGESDVTVDAVRLSDWLEQPVDLLKLDVEGSEFDVIEDLSASGKLDCVGNIICEVHAHSRLQQRVAMLLSSLDQAGFRSTLAELMPWPVGPGPEDPTPFPSVESSKFVLHVYAWRPEWDTRSARAGAAQ